MQPPSPSLNLPKFSPSSIGVYNECAVKWEYAYIDGLKVKGSKQYFDLGNYWHELMHHMYRAVQSGMKIGSDALYGLMEARIRQDASTVTVDNAKIMQTVFKMVRDYIFRQSPKIDSDIASVFGVEYTVSITVTTPKGHTVILEGIADLIYYTLTGRLRVRDHKSGARNPYSDENLQINPQLLNYHVVLAALGHPVEGVEISYANSYDYKNREREPIYKLFDRYSYSPSPVVTSNFWDYLLTRIDTMLEDKPQPSYGQQCGSCAFKQICIMKMNGQNPHFYMIGQYDRANRSYTIPVRWREVSPGVSSESAENADKHSNGEPVFEIGNGLSF